MNHRTQFAIVVAVCLFFSSRDPQVATAQTLTLNHGDHICLVGNALGERMQHHNYFEAWLHGAFNDHELVVRNLCYPGDEPALRRRIDGFGEPDAHLTHSQADVILFFFGLNESFRGADGRDSFAAELKELLQHTAGQTYNGESAPRVVLISPIALENTGDVNFTDGRAENDTLEGYVETMRQVAEEMHVGFADVFHPTLKLFEASDERLTINTIHLNDRGYQYFSAILAKALFGDQKLDLPLPVPAASNRDRVRTAVADKNFHWWHRYRAVNGFSIYGERGLAGSDGKHNNRDVMERERAILDQMCAVRDQRIWKTAKGINLVEPVDDGGELEFIEALPTISGNAAETAATQPDAIKYLSAEEQLATFKLPKGFVIELFASEEQFPDLANPVAINFDDQGRLWVAVMPSYPQWQPKTKLDDKLIILEDADGDGHADHCTTFAGGLHVPTGFELGHGGAYVASQPDIWFLADSDGDDVADQRVRRLVGFCTADSHHGLGSLEWDQAGGLYCLEGLFKRTTLETPLGPQRNSDTAVWYWNPRTEVARVHSSFPLTNPWGLVFDAWGQGFVANGTSSLHYWLTPISGRMDYPRKHAASWKDDEGQDHAYPQFVPNVSRPCSSTELVSSRNFPEEMQGDYLVNNVIGLLGTMRYSVEDKGAGFQGEYADNLVESTDRNFRPSDLQFGPDGTLYLSDWHNALIGHLQHNLRDPNRDHVHGRIWRVRYTGRPLVTPVNLQGRSVVELLKLLSEPEERTRYRVRRRLAAEATEDVMAALPSYIDDAKMSHNQRLMLEALWLHQSHNVVNASLLEQLLGAKDFRVRAAATRAVGDWHTRLEDPIGWLRRSMSDKHPRVRLEAIRACSFVNSPESLDVVLDALNYEMNDEYLLYALEQSMQALDSQ